MANVVNGNTAYIDSTGIVINRKNVLASYIIISASSASAQLVLVDPATAGDANKLNISLTSANDVVQIDLIHNPMLFPNGIKVSTATSVVATIVFKNQGSR